MKKLVIVGASGQGKVITDIARANGYEDIEFLDDNEDIKECAGFPVIGNTSILSDCDGDKFVAIGNSRIRKRFMDGRKMVKLVHPFSVISERAVIEDGCAVMPGAVINSEAYIGEGSIINTCSSVDHDCVLGKYVHVAVGAHIAGTCRIGNHVWIGAGAVVNNNVTICDDCTIGSGAVVVSDIKEPGVYVGIPARKIR